VSLDRALSKLGAASRTVARALITDGRVSVHGRIVRDPGHPVHPERDRILIDGARAVRVPWRMLVLHKPRGTVTTRRDPQGRPTVFDLLGDEARSLVAIGRLDLATAGLLILTTDTQLADRLTDPASGIVRRYAVTVRGRMTDDEAGRMTTGIAGLRAGAVTVRKRSGRETHLLIELAEGQNREVRRLCQATGHEVTALKRIAFGPLELGALLPGAWREVPREEARRLFGPDLVPRPGGEGVDRIDLSAPAARPARGHARFRAQGKVRLR
jgi:pseudouridine synthase